MAKDTNQRVCLGVITGTHGIKGEVKIKTFTEMPEDVAAYGPLQDDTGRRTFEILSCRAGKGAVVARLKGLEDRSSAAALKGVELYVDRDQLPEHDEEDVWYHSDLIGLQAFLMDGERLGEIRAVQNFGAGDLLDIEIQGTRKSVLIPFTRDAVPEVDIDSGRVTIDPPEGLLDDET